MYIISGNFFGYFIAYSYSCPFIIAILIVQVPTPSFVTFAMILVGDVNLLADPLRSPTLPFLVVIAFCMRYIFWRCVGQAIAAKLFAVWTVGHVDVLFVWIPASTFSCARFCTISWWRPTHWCRRCSTAMPMTASFIVFPVSSCSITPFSYQAFALRPSRHCTLVIVVGVGVVGRWLLYQLLHTLNA